MKRKKKDDLYKRGIVAGSTIAGLGGTLYGGTKLLEHGLKGASPEKTAYVLKNFDPKGAKNTAKVVIPVGLGVAGISAYKHYKYKNRNNKK